MRTLAVFLAAQALYFATASGWVWRAPDEFEVYFQTRNLVENRSLSVSVPELEKKPETFFGRRGKDGKTLYAPYGPLVAVLAVPHHLLARLVTTEPLALAGLTSLASATAGALAVAGFYRAARKRAKDERDALLLAGALAVSVLWAYAHSFFSESFSAAALVWALVFHDEKRDLPCALLLGVACLIKATNVFFALPFALASDRRYRLVLGVVAAGLIHMQWNTHRFGSPFQFGYDWKEMIPAGEPRPFSAAYGLHGALALLASPGKSIFVWAPCLLLALPHLRKERVALAAAATGVVAFSFYMYPEGGYCHGPRHLVPIVPLVLVAAAHGFSRRALAVLVAIGLVSVVLAVSVSYLEDQALGDPATHFVYYTLDDVAPAGEPRNVYRLAYLPQISLVRTLLGSPATPGLGLDLFCHHVRRKVGLVPIALGALSLALAWLASRKTLLRTENAAILPPE
ncbi:MAG TPA: hypothetical protein VFF73_25900 [Planctomycetota bacterium]|nr:hypothetical protein [Planctomycetota bacterium]